jgi:hypothetical protein
MVADETKRRFGRPSCQFDMSESYNGADFRQQAPTSKRHRRPIPIVQKISSILQHEEEAAVFGL